MAHPVQDLPVSDEVAGADTSGHHHHIRFGVFLEGRIDGQPQQSVLGPHLAAPVTDEGHIDVGDPLEHL